MSLPEFAMTYVAYFPEHGVLKVGRAWIWQRLNELGDLGAHIIVLQRGTDASWEREALKVLARCFPKAFANYMDAEPVLGKGGKGHTECFAVEEYDLQFALDRCIEGFARGNETGENEATNDRRERPRVAGVREGAGRGEADSVRPVVASGSAGAGADGPGVDRGARLPEAGSDGGGRHGVGAPRDADRCGLPRHLRSGWLRVVAALTTSEARQAGRDDHDSGPARAVSMDVHGWGERGREGAGESRGAGRAGGERSGLGCGAEGPQTRGAPPGQAVDAQRTACVLSRAHAGRLRRYPCGPCRDTRIVREDWLRSAIYEQKLTTFYEQGEADDWHGADLNTF